MTKRELIRYYATIAPTLLPYLAERPLNLNRYPDGVDKKGFWQKQAPKYAPDWIPRWRNDDADKGQSELYLVVDSPPALAWLANHAAIELHPWTSRIPTCTARPTRSSTSIPGTDTSWDDLLTLARLHRTALEHLGVRGYPKTSGQRGLQIWVPIASGPSFDDTRVGRAALALDRRGGRRPRERRMGEERAAGRARLDYTQNAINKTLVAPYSVRASAGATGVDADHLGRARRPRPALRSLDDPHRGRTAGGGRRPHGADARRRAAPPAPRVARHRSVPPGWKHLARSCVSAPACAPSPSLSSRARSAPTASRDVRFFGRLPDARLASSAATRSSTLADFCGGSSASIVLPFAFAVMILRNLLFVVVVVALRIPVTRQRVEDLRGHLLLAGADRLLARGYPVDRRLGNDLVGEEHRRHRQALAVRPDRGEVLLLAHHDLADTDRPRSAMTPASNAYALTAAAPCGARWYVRS